MLKIRNGSPSYFVMDYSKLFSFQIAPNDNGWAVAFGQPGRASGARITYSLALEIQKRGINTV